MKDTPRLQHNNFSHKVLRDAVLRYTETTFRRLASSDWAWLKGSWDSAGATSGIADRVKPEGLRIKPVESDLIPGFEAFLIVMPQPQRCAEAYGVLAAWLPGSSTTARYFVMEKGADESASWLELREDGSSMPGERLPTTDPEELFLIGACQLQLPPTGGAPPPPPPMRSPVDVRPTQPAKSPPPYGDGLFSQIAPQSNELHNVRSGFEIPAWWDKSQLVTLAKDNAGGVFSFWIGILALAVTGVFGVMAFSDWSSKHGFCRDEEQNATTAAELCYQRRESVYGISADEQVEWTRCREEAGDRSVYDYCMDRASRWKGKAHNAAISAAVAAFFFFFWLLVRNRSPAFVKVLRDQPQRVVWVYIRTTRYRGSGTVSVVYLGLENGSEVMVWPGRLRADDVANSIAGIVPWATFGYTDELRLKFRQSPSSLRRD